MTEKYASLLKEYRRLAKRADQRMVRLEKLEKKEGYENVRKYAYKRAEKDIAQYGKGKKPRWNTKPPADTGSLKAKIADIKNFLNSVSSTKKGIDELYKKRADKLNTDFKTDFTWQDLANFFQSKTWENLASKLGSKTALTTVAKIQKNEEEIVRNIKEDRERVINIGDWKVDSIINQLLSANKIDLNDMFGSE